MLEIIRKIVNASNYVGAAFLLVLMLIIAGDVALRFSGNPVIGVFELSEFILALAVWGGLANTTLHRGHVRIDLIVSRLSAKTQGYFDLAGDLLGLGLFGIIIWKGMEGVMTSKRVGEVRRALDLPVYPFKLVIPIGAFLVCLVIILQLIESKRSHPKEEE